MPTPIWQPSEKQIESAQITQFRHFINQRHGLSLSNFHALYQWSVDSNQDFWQAVWDFCEVIASVSSKTVLQEGAHLTEARWFPEARLNFAENLLRFRNERIAIVSLLENGERATLTYAQLYESVARLAAQIRADGVVAGDTIVGFMPNIAETVIAMLATASIGALWSSCSPDFGYDGVLERFGQVAPRMLFATDGYYYNNKSIDTLGKVSAIVDSLDSLEKVVIVPLINPKPDLSEIGQSAVLFQDYLSPDASEIKFEPLPFNHPLYIMYSSGTTGKPKCIVHGAGGTLLQHLKEHRLHVDLRPEDKLFYFTTCGWMMWNWLISGLASNATLILYDGSPFAAKGNILLNAIDEEGISVFGISARYIASLQKRGKRPKQSHQLTHLRVLLSTGSPLSHESFEYVYRDIKQDVCLASISGGTDIISCFVLGCPILPVYAGEIQTRGLGMAVEIRNDQGQPVVGEKGELVCSRPFPSMPVGFWNDDSGEKYRSTYFSRWPDIWVHGDYGELTEIGGVVIYGRSDTLLNPGGVRIGTAEIYRQIERMDEIVEGVVIGQHWEGDVRLILFVMLQDGVPLDDALRHRIQKTIEQNTTKRHVPAKILSVTDIPRTLNGKVAELAVRNVVHGQEVKNTEALANPEALALFRQLVTQAKL